MVHPLFVKCNHGCISTFILTFAGATLQLQVQPDLKQWWWQATRSGSPVNICISQKHEFHFQPRAHSHLHWHLQLHSQLHSHAHLHLHFPHVITITSTFLHFQLHLHVKQQRWQATRDGSHVTACICFQNYNYIYMFKQLRWQVARSEPPVITCIFYKYIYIHTSNGDRRPEVSHLSSFVFFTFIVTLTCFIGYRFCNLVWARGRLSFVVGRLSLILRPVHAQQFRDSPVQVYCCLLIGSLRRWPWTRRVFWCNAHLFHDEAT